MENVRRWNYVEIKKIGEGGYGEVHKCRNLITGQLVAIKMIRIRNGVEGVPSYIVREVSLLKELQHENVVGFQEVFSVENLVFLVFEYLDIDLHSLICKIVLDPPVVKAILKQILLGLAYCHSVNVLHRDLKPNNLLIDLKSNTVKIADFGLARSSRVPQKEYSRDYAYTPYKAPELLFGYTEYSTPVDVWALGCIFAEMIIGECLFPGTKRDQLLAIFSLFGTPTEEIWPGVTRIKELALYPKFKAQNLANKFPDLEPAGVDLLSKMLCLNPKHRITINNALEHVYLRGVEKEPLVLYLPSGIFLHILRRSKTLSDIVERHCYTLAKRLLKQDI